MKDLKDAARRRKNKKSGSDFEKRVRKDLEEKGWIVDRWTNNVELGTVKWKKEVSDNIKIPFENATRILKSKIIPARARWNYFTKQMIMKNAGFPDFVAFQIEKKFYSGALKDLFIYNVIGVECKTDGTLSRIEKQKCKWYLNNQIFSKILIASKTKVKNRIVIVYKEFKNE